MFFSPIQQLSQVLDTWQQAGASVEKIEELLDTPSGTPAPVDPVVPGRLRGVVRFDDVRFAYPQHGRRARARRRRPSPSRPARPWRSSARPARASRRSSSSWPASTTRPRASSSVDGIDLRDDRPRRVPPPARHRAPGGLPVHRHGPRQHRLRPARRHRRRGRGRGPCGRRPRVRRLAAARLPRAGERAGSVAVVRAAPADRARPGPAGRPGDPPARRGDVAARPRQRGAGAAGDAGRRRGPHHDPRRRTASRPPPAPTASWSSTAGASSRRGRTRRCWRTTASTPACGRRSPRRRRMPPPSLPDRRRTRRAGSAMIRHGVERSGRRRGGPPWSVPGRVGASPRSCSRPRAGG